MQPYQNYQYPAMNQYPQNFNQPMQAQNPYMERMAQLQQYQQNLNMFPSQMSGTSQPQPQPQPQSIICKSVADATSVSPNDVPMDGNPAVFPKMIFQKFM